MAHEPLMSAGPLAGPSLLRRLPAVGKLMDEPALCNTGAPEKIRTIVAREVVVELRAAVADGTLQTPEQLGEMLAALLTLKASQLGQMSLRPLLNGTGVLLHTNLGRSPLCAEALRALGDVAAGYSNLELDLGSGERGSRQSHCRPLLRWLSGAEDALVVNNGAAAILLALHAVAAGRPVVVSRGELVEIGGGFRVPEVMAASGAQLVEVGTTNRTHLRDYQRALEELAAQGRPAGAILRVHRSNFAIIGFETHPDTPALARLAHRFKVPLLVDLGSGATARLAVEPAPLPDGTRPGPESTLAEVVAAGADLVTCSGDKLLGGPQAGIVVGSEALTARLGTSPLARALRVGSLTLAALEATLRQHLRGSSAELPAAGQLHEPHERVLQRATAWAASLELALQGKAKVEVCDAIAQVGGGTHPMLVLHSTALAIAVAGLPGAALEVRLRQGALPVLGRARGAQVLLDVRTLWASRAGRDEAALVGALALALGQACASTGAGEGVSAMVA